MKKKNLFAMLTIMMVALLSVSVVSCSKDDENSGGDSQLVGKWYDVGRDYTCGWVFKSNGTCQYGEWGKGHAEFFGEDIGKWTASGNQLHVHWTYDDGDYDDDIYTYSISEDGKTLTLTDGDYGMAGTFTKQ